MQIIALLLIVYFVVGASVCLLICVNPNDPGVLGRLNRFVFRTIPEIFMQSIVKRFFGDRVLNFLGGIKHYLTQTNHPIVQIFYLLIAVGGFILYEIYGIFKHMPNSQVSDIEVVLANFLALVCFWTYYKACEVGPGKVTKENMKKMVEKYDKYYDNILYKKQNQCKTCHLLKPARSKHCSICQMCVSKYDHHCVWIRQCVGEQNYKYFVSFLLLHSLWCLFLSFIGTRSLISYLNRISFWKMSFNINGERVQADPLIALQFLFVTQTIFFFLIVMCAIMGFTLFIFVGYHFFLIYKGQTTNQRVKKNDQISHYEKQLKVVEKYQKIFASKEGGQVKQIDFRGEKVTKTELSDYKEQCKRRKTELQRVIQNKGFFAKIEQVLKA